MQRTCALLLVIALVCELPLSAGIPKNKSMYVGGTLEAIPQGCLGVLSADSKSEAAFTCQKDKKSATLQIPYEKVTNLAYGQHAGRRVGATVAWGATTLGIMALPMLFSKKRKHYLTIEYTDADGKAQAGIFEVGKDTVRVLIKTLEVRTGKKVEYEDDEARKAGNK